MTSVSTKHAAIRDAEEYARAKMFYGEGAGVRRRLINQTVQFKKANLPGYSLAFEQALAKKDFAKISRQVTHERRRIDTVARINRNGKALVRGDYRALSLPIFVIGGAVYVAHKTGYDKEAMEYVNAEYKKARQRVKVWREERKAKKKEQNKPTIVPDLGATGPMQKQG